MDKPWSEIIAEIRASGLTYAQIAEQVQVAGSTIGDLASKRSKSPRGDTARRLLRLHRRTKKRAA